ncbi:hypothetical protein RIR_jg38629.t1 [Rhizophagus irregularis DAOM 181602=DAOM 197198]|nr:hypothetical protein RIR_jg38629.t1 [Rhizophagus irregularis DAOM 181602=DAOM 197198]
MSSSLESNVAAESLIIKKNEMFLQFVYKTKKIRNNSLYFILPKKIYKMKPIEAPLQYHSIPLLLLTVNSKLIILKPCYTIFSKFLI